MLGFVYLIHASCETDWMLPLQDHPWYLNLEKAQKKYFQIPKASPSITVVMRVFTLAFGA